MGCSKAGALITFGVIFIIIGFIMTIYGFISKPFWSTDSWFREDALREQQNIDDCRIAGPIFLVMGIVFIVIGSCLRKKELSDHVQTGNQAIAPTGTRIINYSATGNVPQNITYPQQSQFPAQPFYQIQGQYPQQPQYSPQQQYYPPHQQYPPQQQYSLQSQNPPQHEYFQQQPQNPNYFHSEKDQSLPPPPSYQEASAPSYP